MTDRQIKELYFNRSDSAVSATAEKYGAYCHKIAFNILEDERDAEECVNDTYLSVWNAIPPHSPENLATFIGKITRNLAINRYKERLAQKRGGGQTALALEELSETIPSSSGIEKVLEDAELTELLNEFLRKLSKKKRNVFIRRYWSMESLKDIAEDLGMSETSLASMLHRIRRQLRLFMLEKGVKP